MSNLRQHTRFDSKLQFFFNLWRFGPIKMCTWVLTWFCRKNCVCGLIWFPLACCSIASCCSCCRLCGFWKACRLPNICRWLPKMPPNPPRAARAAPTPGLELVTWELGVDTLGWSVSAVTWKGTQKFINLRRAKVRTARHTRDFFE